MGDVVRQVGNKPVINYDGNANHTRRNTKTVLSKNKVSDKKDKHRIDDYNDSKPDLRIEALGGLCAGIVGTVIGYPLDLIKTRMQTDTHKKTGSTKGNGILRIGSSILRQEGFAALYKGMVPPLISLSILNTLNFASYNYVRSNILNANRGWDIQNALSGMAGAPLGSSISTVEHMVKTQMQLDNVQQKKFRGSWHCVTQLVKEHGISILYKGHFVNTVREGVFLGTYFFTYEGLREELSNNVEKFGIAKHLSVPLAGGISGAWAWFVSFPLDCIKAGVQGQNYSIYNSSTESLINRPKGAIQVLNHLWQTKGLKGLYAGVTPSINRAFLVSASRFSAYEFAVWTCRNLFD